MMKWVEDNHSPFSSHGTACVRAKKLIAGPEIKRRFVAFLFQICLEERKLPVQVNSFTFFSFSDMQHMICAGLVLGSLLLLPSVNGLLVNCSAKLDNSRLTTGSVVSAQATRRCEAMVTKTSCSTFPCKDIPNANPRDRVASLIRNQ